MSAYWLIAYSMVALVSIFLNFDIIPHPAKNIGRVKYFIFGYIGIYVLRHWLPETTSRTKMILVNVFLSTIMLAAVYSFINFDPAIIEKSRARGFTETMRYGYGSAMLLLTLLGALVHREKIKAWFDWRVGLPAFILGFIALYLSYTRGALLGFLCGLPFTLYFFKPKLGKIFAGVAILAVIGLGSAYLLGSSTNTTSRFLINKNNESDVIRRSQWKAAIIAIQERPVLGWGLSNFHSQLKRIKYDYDLDAKNYNDAHSHNLFLEVASGTGLIGLFFFLGWIITWALEVFKKDVLTKSLVIPFCVSWIVSSQFEVTFDANNASMIFFLYVLSVQRRSHV